MQIANIVHVIGSRSSWRWACVHIYLGTIGIAGAYDGMRTGYVDETWAREHHEYWYNDVKAGNAPAGDDAHRPMRHKPA